MKTGISLYFSNGIEKNEEMIRKAAKAGIAYAFTSIHIPEETGIEYWSDIKKLLKQCSDAGIHLIVDISPVTLEKLGCTSFDDLLELGITYIRLDFGFTPKETAALSKKFYIVFNASTITPEAIQDWKSNGADFTRFTACHNYYPKPFTGLSLTYVADKNRWLKDLGFTTMSFVPGNINMRGPLWEGLPTVEEHRYCKEEVLLNMLSLYQADSDIVLVGDCDVTKETWIQLTALNQGYISLRASLKPGYEFVEQITHHDRPDSSDYVIRSQESRLYYQGMNIVPDWQTDIRTVGSICIANEGYLRYMGELEIVRSELPAQERVNLIGQVAKEHHKYLPYIRNGMGFRLYTDH